MRTIFILLAQVFVLFQLNAQCIENVAFFPGDEFPPIQFCSLGSDPVTLLASPAGGTFSGNGVNGDSFNPEQAGEGDHVISYTVTLECGTITGDITMFVTDCCPITSITVPDIVPCDPFNPEEFAPINITVNYTPNQFSSNKVFVKFNGTKMSRAVSNPAGFLEAEWGLPYDGVERKFIVADKDGHCVRRKYFRTAEPCGCGLDIVAFITAESPDCPDGVVSRTMKYRSSTPAEVSLDNGNTYIPGLIVPSSGGLEATFVIPGIGTGGNNLVLRSTEDPTCIAEPLYFNVFVIEPVPICKDITVYLDENGQVSINPVDVVDENDPAFCDSWQLSVNPSAFICESIGPNTVTLTAEALTSIGNETGTCSSVVTVLDNLGPEITCVDPLVEFNGEEMIMLEPEDLADYFDNCGLSHVIIDPQYVTCSQIGTVVPISVTAFDIYGNSASCTSNVTVGGLPCGFSTCPGHVDCADSYASFNPLDQTFHLTGVNCFYVSPYNSDELAYIRHEFCGDGEIIAKLESVGGSTFGWAGISLRENCDPGSKKMEIIHNGANLIRREARIETGGYAFPQQYPIFNRRWFRLVRQGNQFIAYISPNGVNWQFIGAKIIDMPYCIEAGLAVTNYQPVSNVTGVFSNVQITSEGSGCSGCLTAPDDRDISTNPDIAFSNQSVDLQSDGTLMAYPNPSTGGVMVEFSENLKQGHLEVVNNLGQKIRSYAIEEDGANSIQLTLGDLPKGVYFLKMEKEDGGFLTERLILH